MAIERKFIEQNMREFMIKEFIYSKLPRAGISGIKVQKTPLGHKIIISASKPGLVVGRGGSNIQKLTNQMDEEFDLEKVEVEIEEVENPNLDPSIISERIANTLERFGPQRFKGTGYRAMTDVMEAGALGVEILINGKIPGSRSRTWRFYDGYLKKCGNVAKSGVKTAYAVAELRSGTVGVKARIMPPDAELPDKIDIKKGVEEVKDEEVVEEMKEAKKETKSKKDKGEESKTKSKKKSEEKEKDKKSKKKKSKKGKKKDKKKSKDKESKDKKSKKSKSKKSKKKKSKKKSKSKKSKKSKKAEKKKSKKGKKKSKSKSKKSGKKKSKKKDKKKSKKSKSKKKKSKKKESNSKSSKKKDSEKENE